MTETIEELKARIVELESQVAVLRHFQGRKVIEEPPAPLERQVTISCPTPPPASDLPSPEELVRLRDLCTNRFPNWTDSRGFPSVYRKFEVEEDGWLVQFEQSILAISHMNLLAKPDNRYEVSFHVDAAKDVLMRIGRRARELRPGPFVMACMVMHVPVSGIGIPGGSVSLGLAEWSNSPVDPSAWRKTLEASRLPQLFLDDRPRIKMVPSNVRITYEQGR